MKIYNLFYSILLLYYRKKRVVDPVFTTLWSLSILLWFNIIFLCKLVFINFQNIGANATPIGAYNLMSFFAITFAFAYIASKTMYNKMIQSNMILIDKPKPFHSFLLIVYFISSIVMFMVSL
jgi:hypothetical protein